MSPPTPPAPWSRTSRALVASLGVVILASAVLIALALSGVISLPGGLTRLGLPLAFLVAALGRLTAASRQADRKAHGRGRG